jgi:lipid-A-disaccharide synthase
MKYYIIAGEASGDLHGSNLIREIKKLDTGAEFRAWGGDKMLEAGAHVIKHFKDHNYMGFAEVIVHLRKIIENFRFCKRDILNYQPDALILIDFPGFNLRMATWAKKQGIRVIYYISPQIWAWKTSRVHTIKRVVDRMITILPFEQEFYQKFNIDVDYVGHPLLDTIQLKHDSKPEDNNIITLLPGSRKQEIKRMLPVMVSLAERFPEYRFVIAGVGNIEIEYYRRFCNQRIEIVYNQLFSLLSSSKAAIVTSGTATLETALYNVPLTVCYKSTPLSYHIAKRLIRVPYISLVNLIMNKPLVRELIQHDMNAESLGNELHKLLHNIDYRSAMLNGFTELRELLGNKGASKKAAIIVTGFARKHKTV